MCYLKALKKSYTTWLEKSPINPFTLNVKDQEVQNNYNIWKRKMVYELVKIMSIFSWPLLLIYYMWNYQHGFEYQARFYTEFGSFIVTATIMLIVMKIKTTSADYVPLIIISVRVGVTFLLFYLISAGTEGFELVDQKELHSSIPFIAMPFLLLTFDNLFLNLAITIPVVLVGTVSATSFSLAVQDDNMSCYKQPELAANDYSFYWII